jgi:hypothetical protein
MSIRRQNLKAPKPLSLQEVEQKVEAGKNQIHEAGKILGSLREEIDSKQSEVQAVSEQIKQLQETVAVVRKEVEEVQVEKRKAEGELTEAENKLSEVEKSTDIAVEAEKKQTAEAISERATVLAHTKEIESKARETIAELEQRETNLKGEISVAADKLILLTREEGRLKEILKNIPLREEALKKIEMQILEKQVEEKKQGERLTQATQLLNQEKHKLDEMKALVLSTEKEVETKLAQLVEKEADVERKTTTLRNIQLGLDRTEARMDRKKHEDELKDYLSRNEKETKEEVET